MPAGIRVASAGLPPTLGNESTRDCRCAATGGRHGSDPVQRILCSVAVREEDKEACRTSIIGSRKVSSFHTRER